MESLQDSVTLITVSAIDTPTGTSIVKETKEEVPATPSISSSVLNVKWSNRSLGVDWDKTTTVSGLKRKLFELTNVRPEKQKLIGMPKLGGKNASDEMYLHEFEFKPSVKVMMVGTPDEKMLIEPDLTEGEDIVNDLDVNYHKEELKIAEDQEHQRRLQKRIETVNIEIRNPPRKGKKCLVLDIDYTLFDHRSTAERPHELMRPYLHEFLAACYREYDLVLWSATSMKWIDIKMTELGVYSNPNYSITFALSSSAMFSVTSYRKEEKRVHEAKALGVIWAKFPEYYGPGNTIHLDDLSRNFAMNPQNGLQIRPFRKAHLNRSTDRELYALTQYLLLIAKLNDFGHLDHSRWEEYVEKHGHELAI